MAKDVLRVLRVQHMDLFKLPRHETQRPEKIITIIIMTKYSVAHERIGAETTEI